MKKNHSDMKIEAVIRASMKMTDAASPELNRQLKAALYQQEAALRKRPVARELSLWYLPMVLNLITFSLLALAAVIVIESVYFSCFAVGVCLYMGGAGVLLTIVGVKRADIKRNLIIHIRKRGTSS